MKIVKLRSRGKENNYLEKTGNLYRLVTENNYKVGFKDSTEDLEFVDPSGGPFMKVGYRIEGLGEIESIKHINGRGVFIEIKDDISGNSTTGSV